jgi:hypothetical protein
MEAALGAIGRIGAHKDVDLVCPMLDDHVSIIRDAACDAFCRLANYEDIPFLFTLMSEGMPWDWWPETMRTISRVLPSIEVLPRMGGLMLNGGAGVAYLAAQAAVPRMDPGQLHEFLAKHERELAPPVLAIFDWHLHAPAYLKEELKKWRPVT